MSGTSDAGKGIRFDGRVAIVTGSGGGLGKAYCLAMAQRGASVIVNDIARGGPGASGSAAEAVVEQIRAAGGKAVASHDSVATPEGGRAIAQTALDAFGRIDVLINNAGRLRHKAFEEKTQEDIDLTLSTHLNGSIYVTQHAFRAMKAQGYGRIVFTSSSAAIGLPWRAIYAAAKLGVVGLMNGLAGEGQAHGILCNALMPGADTTDPRTAADSLADTRTPVPAGVVLPQGLIDLKEAWNGIDGGLKPEFVVPMALYLASERCSVTRSIYSAVAARYARVFIGLAPGWQAKRDVPPRPEDIERHIGVISDPEGYIIPESGIDELRLLAGSRSN